MQKFNKNGEAKLMKNSKGGFIDACAEYYISRKSRHRNLST